jgi:hypothetical protein
LPGGWIKREWISAQAHHYGTDQRIRSIWTIATAAFEIGFRFEPFAAFAVVQLLA